MPRTIETNQAPAAKPVGLSLSVPTDWAVIVTAPQYDVLAPGFGSDRRIAPGAAEISSPLLVSNVTDGTVTVDVLIQRSNGDVSEIARSYMVPAKDAVLIPVQGQFLITGDELHVRAGLADALFATLSYTEGQAEEDDVT